MHNISTIYRFNTPFLDLEQEKGSLLAVIKKIEKSIEFDGVGFKKESTNEGNYYKVLLKFQGNLGKVEFFYILDIGNNIYHLPIFKLNIFLNNSFLVGNENRERSVKFLNNIFECFDGLNEKEYLIDIDESLYYKYGLFGSKRYPSYDFSNLNKIKDDFESNNGMQQLKDFIIKFQNKNYILTKDNADEYHRLHGILLYFIYLVFLVSQTLEKTNEAKNELSKVEVDGIYEGHVNLMNERLTYVDELNRATFERYKNRLELFFKMF